MTGAPPTLAPPRPDASMTLLTSVIERPLDPGYAAAAARRSAAGLPPATPLRGPLILGAGLVAGLVLSVSAMTLRAGETDEARVRTDLITQIQDRRGVADERATQVGKLQAEVAELEDAALGDAALGGLATRLASLRTQVGAEALRGPGMVISLNDRPTTADGVPADAEGKVLSRDVFIVVNGLWEAGAEAIGSIWGRRRRRLREVTQRQLWARHRHQDGHRGQRAERVFAQGGLRPPGIGGDPVIPAFGLLLGVVIGIVVRPDVPLWMQPYLPIAVVAALDAVFGGVRAVLDGIFNDRVFVISFLSNVVVAAFIVFLGDQLGVGGQLSTGVVVVLGVRIFSNVASIRRHLFDA